MPGPSGSRATRPTTSSASISASFYTPEDFDAGVPHRALETAREDRALRGRRLARPQGRHPVLGERGHRRHPRRARRAHRLRQDHPRHDREARGAAAAGGIARAAVPVAEDGGARAAHGRAGARFQQPADGDPRRHRACTAQHRQSGEGAADARRRPQLGAARRRPHQAVARLRAGAAAPDQADRPQVLLRRCHDPDPPLAALEHRGGDRDLGHAVAGRRGCRSARACHPQPRLQCARRNEGRRYVEDQPRTMSSSTASRTGSRASMSR